MRRLLGALLLVLNLDVETAFGFRPISNAFTFKTSQCSNAKSKRLPCLGPRVSRRMFTLRMADPQPPVETVLPGMKRVLFIEMGFGADQHGQVSHVCRLSVINH